MKYASNSAKQTMQIAKEFARTLSGGETILLSGRIGSGKTVFVKGMAKGLEVCEDITSPTFTIMNIYNSGKKILCHCDAYRLDGILDIGLEDYLGRDDVICVIEWPQNILLEQENKVINIDISYIDENQREINID